MLITIPASESQRPATPEAALAALNHVVAQLSSVQDPRAAFPDVYAVITQKVIERLNDGSGYFHAPEFISMLVGVFTTRYLQTLDWSLRGVPQDCRGWDLAYQLAAQDSLPATAHAVLGISAHINYDLALGIHEVVVRLGAAGDQARLELFKHDHDAVNALLAASFPESWSCLNSSSLAWAPAAPSRTTTSWMPSARS